MSESAARVLVQGPGAIGTFLAARLARAGTEVALLDRNRARAARLTRRGVTLRDTSGEEHEARSTFRIPVLCGTPADDARDERRFSLLITCVKAYDLEDALPQGLAWISAKGRLLVLANGLAHLQLGARFWPAERTAVATTDHGVSRLEEGVVRHLGGSSIRLGPPAGGEGSVEVLRRAGFHAELVDDPARLLWQKAVINCALNPVAALIGMSNGEFLESPALPVADAVIEEVIAVARRLHHDWQGAARNWHQQLRRVCRATAENRCSMLRDLEAGRLTEIEQLNGHVERAAAELDVEVPVTQTLARLIRARSAAQGVHRADERER